MSNSDERYKIREVTFLGKRKPIVCQKAGESSPLVTISNLLLLKNGLPRGTVIEKTADGDKCIHKDLLLNVVDTLLMRRLKDTVNKGVHTQEFVNASIPRFKEAILLLPTSLDLNTTFEKTTGFAVTTHYVVFGCLEAFTYHGWLVDPKDTDTSKALGSKSYVQLIDEINKSKMSKSKTEELGFQPCGDLEEEAELKKAMRASEDDIQHAISLVQIFLNNSESQLTSYGLTCLRKDVPEGVLSLFFRKGQISVLYKYEGVLHILQTDEGLLERQPDLMWKTLDNVNEDGALLTSSFGPVNVDWCKNASMLMEEEARNEKTKRIRHEKNMRKRLRKKERSKTTTQEESEEAKIELSEETESNAAEDPSITDRFMHFLMEFRNGTERPHFRGQVKAMEYLEYFHLDFCYTFILRYDEELAVFISNNYYRDAEDLRLCVCKYLTLVMEDESLEKQDEIYRRTKLNICCMPPRNSIQSFKEFTEANTMYTVYQLERVKVNSTSYVGRMMALGYLKFIMRTHKSGFCWNGGFNESHMQVKIVNGVMEFIITLVAMMPFQKARGIADFEQYRKIIFPHYMSKEVEGYPAYFDQFQGDFLDMPEHDHRHPEEFDKFQMYMGSHFFAKAPLARSALICNAFRVCDSMVFDYTASFRRAYGPLDVKHDVSYWDDYVEHFSAALYEVYTWRHSSTGTNWYDKLTYWCILMLGRHSIEHLFDHTKKDGVQLIQDAVIVDLILAHDLRGLMAEVVKFMMDINTFNGPFRSIWRHFEASETYDEPINAAADGSGETKLIVAAEDPAPATAAAPHPARAPPKLECVLCHGEAKLTRDDLNSLEGDNFLLDGVIHFVFARMSSAYARLDDDLFLVPPSVSFLLTNLDTKAAVAEHAGTLSLRTRRVVLLPVNNNQRFDEADSGTHWSLLVIHIAEDHASCRFVHHDSVGSTNRTAAVRLADALRQLLPAAPPVIQGPTPEQVNGYDCGVYMLAVSNAICCWWRDSGRNGSSDCWFSAVTLTVNAERVKSTRKQMWLNFNKEMRRLAKK